MNKHQLEIKLALTPATRRRESRQRNAARAQWWFERMRRVVDATVECRPVSPRQSRQSTLPLLPNRNAA